MENIKENDSRASEIQGKYNLEMGVHLAWEDLQKELDAVAQDDSLPTMSPEEVNSLLAAANAEYDRLKTEKKRASRRNRFLQWGISIAAVVIIIPIAAMNVNASRTAISNYVIQNFGKYGAVQYDEGYNTTAPFGWRSEYYPRWIPEGYHIASVEFREGGDYLWYTSDDNKEISFFVQYSLELSVPRMVNNENYTEKGITVNGRDATLYLSADKRQVTLVLPLPNSTLVLEGMLSEKAICNIAESIALP